MRQLKIEKRVTNRDDNDGLQAYLNWVYQWSHPLSPEAEVALGKARDDGDETAVHTLVVANLRFVVSVAKQYQWQGLSLSDLINEGNIGLHEAALRYDWTKGFKFISYAVNWIRQCILTALREARLVKVPQSTKNIQNKVIAVVNHFEQQHGYMPHPYDVSEHVKRHERQRAAESKEVRPFLLDEHDVDFMVISYSTKHVSLDEPTGDEETTTRLDLTPNTINEPADASAMSESLSTDIQRALKHLPPREREVIILHFGLADEPMTLSSIAERYELDPERIRQIKERALKRIRTSPYAKVLRCYV